MKLPPLLYLAWIISSALTALDWAVLRTTTVAIADAISKAVPIEQQAQRGWLLQWAVAAVDQFAVFGFGVIALGLVISFDYVYRTGLAKGTLKKRFGIVTAARVAVLVICAMVLFVLRSMNVGG